MFKGSFIKTIIGVLILLASYAFPFFLVPVGTYSHKESGVTIEYSFAWNGKVKRELSTDGGSISAKQYYKIDDKAIHISDDKDFKVNKLNKAAEIKNIYTLEIDGEDYKNYWALGFTIIGYVLTAWGVIGFFVPKKKK